MTWLIGIDEVGRGPLAGPVGVGVVIVPSDFDWSVIPGVGDCKKVSEKNRNAIFSRAEELKAAGLIRFEVVLISAEHIDSFGIVSAIKTAIAQGLDTLIGPENSDCDLLQYVVKLDGGLKAPATYVHQETIIKGDAKEPVIGLASIVAKVTRDLYMQELSTLYPEYGFAGHKGYGTKAHILAIKTFGLSTAHRASYCQNIKIEVKL